MALTPRCEARLQGVHPDLAKVVRLASDKCKFRVTEGLRDIARQRELVASKKSKTMNSRHLTGHAIDFIAIGDDGIATYDMDDMKKVADAMREAAKECGTRIEWGAMKKYGGDWTWNDSPHIQLTWKDHPAQGVSLTTKIVERLKDAKVAVPVAATGGVTVPNIEIPKVPDVSAIAGWQHSMETVSGFGKFLMMNPIMAVAAVALCLAVFVIPKLRGDA